MNITSDIRLRQEGSRHRGQATVARAGRVATHTTVGGIAAGDDQFRFLSDSFSFPALNFGPFVLLLHVIRSLGHFALLLTFPPSL